MGETEQWAPTAYAGLSRSARQASGDRGGFRAAHLEEILPRSQDCQKCDSRPGLEIAEAKGSHLTQNTDVRGRR